MEFSRCKNCYRCPRCTCVLSTRAHVAQTDASKSVAGSQDQAAPKATEISPSTTRRGVGRTTSGSSIKGDIKKLYLLCNSCQWSSRQANIADVKNGKYLYQYCIALPYSSVFVDFIAALKIIPQNLIDIVSIPMQW